MTWFRQAETGPRPHYAILESIEAVGESFEVTGPESTV